MSALFEQAGALIRVVDSILDVGAGIRPQPFFKAKHHLCIEPHGEYVAWLNANGYPVKQKTAAEYLRDCEPVDSIFLLDVIEHMEKVHGSAVIEMAKAKARHQVIIFTPIGFVPQSCEEGDKDRWGMNGGFWQTHRSGWTPDEFPGWCVLADPHFHGADGAFFAIFGT